MEDEQVQIGRPQAHWSANGSRILKYSVEIYHSGLNEHRLVTAPEIDMIKTKVALQLAKWNEKWTVLEDRRQVQQKRASDAKEAERLTGEAQQRIRDLERILINTLSVDDTIDWESLKVREEFSEQEPKEPKAPALKEYSPKPNKTWPQFIARYSLLEKIFKGLKEKKNQQIDGAFRDAFGKWEKEQQQIARENHAEEAKHAEAVKEWQNSCKAWQARKVAFYQEQETFNAGIDQLRERYAQHDQNAVEQYCEMVLNNSKYPDYFSKDFELLYNPETKILICEYYLPEPEALPRLREVRFIASKGELRESNITDSQAEKQYDNVIYQIVLRTLHELFEADSVNALEAISLNGRVRFVSKATGRPEEACIVSIQVKKQELAAIDLKNVDPKTCFKSLKGIGSSKLHGIMAVKPVLQIDKSDRRFVEAHAVANSLDETTNIAAMDWEEFEHLIRELFQKEFSQGGGEVKITQASRDGGVDAVAFDPDPIRGGKIVIQAKRYTNTVGVSAVRDLYGTVVNEGATKGILVTTADYGPDAYEFAKNKPLTLLSGGNLLHLLEKHGHKVRIDIREAKKVLGERLD
jgi:restriction system protein